MLQVICPSLVDEVEFIVRNQSLAELSLNSEEAFKDFSTSLDSERPRNVFSGNIKRQPAIASNGAATHRVVPNINQPIAKSHEGLISVLTRVDEPLKALVFLDDSTCPAAEAAVLGATARCFVLAEDDGALTTLGIAVKLEQLLVGATPRGREGAEDFPHVISGQVDDGPKDIRPSDTGVFVEIRAPVVLVFVDGHHPTDAFRPSHTKNHDGCAMLRDVVLDVRAGRLNLQAVSAPAHLRIGAGVAPPNQQDPERFIEVRLRACDCKRQAQAVHGLVY